MKAINNVPSQEEKNESAGAIFYVFNGLLILSAALFVGYLIYLFVS